MPTPTSFAANRPQTMPRCNYTCSVFENPIIELQLSSEMLQSMSVRCDSVIPHNPNGKVLTRLPLCNNAVAFAVPSAKLSGPGFVASPTLINPMTKKRNHTRKNLPNFCLMDEEANEGACKNLDRLEDEPANLLYT